MEAVRGGFWHMDVAQKKFETSDRLAQFIGGSEAALLDLQRYVEKINSADGASADLTPLLDGEVDQSVAEYRLMTVNGERWMRCDRRLLRDEAGHPKRIVVIDFTDEKTRLDHFERSAETDALTGLLNRRGLQKASRRWRPRSDSRS
jgi:GGDEF domain-containing protein